MSYEEPPIYPTKGIYEVTDYGTMRELKAPTEPVTFDAIAAVMEQIKAGTFNPPLTLDILSERVRLAAEQMGAPVRCVALNPDQYEQLKVQLGVRSYYLYFSYDDIFFFPLASVKHGEFGVLPLPAIPPLDFGFESK